MKLQPHIEAVLGDHDTLSVFGLILFTESHPHIVKVLRDEDYWTQFDAISGKKFAIFSAKPRQGRYEHSAPPPGSFGMMRMVWREPAENKELLSTFHLADTKSLPQFIVFAQMPDDTILQSSLSLSDENEEQAYKRLKEVVTVVSEAADGIAEQYKSDTVNVYNAFASKIQGFKEREAIIKAIGWIPFINKIKSWIPT